MQGPNAVLFKASRDEVYMLAEINRILNEQEWTGGLNRIIGENAENTQLLKEVLIYTQKEMGKLAMQDTFYYILIPLISVFRNY